MELHPGDIVVVGTDGLFDNVFDEDIAEQATRFMGCGMSGYLTANLLATDAFLKSAKRDIDCPYSRGAEAAGWTSRGGKLDDITVMVAIVSE